MSALYDLASLVVIPSGIKAQKIYAQKPMTTDGQLTFSRASTATRTNASGVVESVASNVPRLDYSGGATCPRLLLEPQRTNLITYSEQFNNASWTKATSTITANTTTSPDGTANADTLLADGTFGIHATWNTASVTSGTTYTYTIYAKKGTNDFLQLYWGVVLFGSNAWVNFNLNTGTVGSIGSAATASIQSVGNGWYRLITTATATTSGSNQVVGNNIITSATSPRAESNTLSTSVFLWGAQAEVGSFATSYIPTTTAAVTRLADACSKTGISSLIGQTEGALFIDVVPTDISSQGRYISIEAAAGVGSGWIGIFADGLNNFRFYGDGFDLNAGAQVRGTRYKVAMAYKNGVLTSAYINGTSVGTLTANTTGKSYANLKLASAAIGNAGCSDFFQSLIFKTALTNAQLAELTAL